MTTELDQALLTGDAESIDESLNQMELDEALLFGDDDDLEAHNQNEQTAVAQEEPDTPEVIDTTNQAPQAADQAQGSGDQNQDDNADQLEAGFREIDGQLYAPIDPSQAKIAGKNGEHTIPYAVLESARGDTTKYRSKAEDLQKQLNEAQSGSRRAELLQQQLEEAGLTPDKLPEELLNDPDAINALQDEIGGQAGQVIAALVKKIAGQQDSSEPSGDTGAGAVDEALNSESTTELRDWEKNDPDRWQMALIIDNKLKDDPNFQSMPLQERFAEVQRRVKVGFGDPVAASAEQIVNNQQQPDSVQNATQTATQNAPQTDTQQQPPAQAPAQIPNSPSSLSGSAADTTQAAHEALASQDAMALESSLSKMSPQDVELFLANAALALD